jgi:hypothetical protein
MQGSLLDIPNVAEEEDANTQPLLPDERLHDGMPEEASDRLQPGGVAPLDALVAKLEQCLKDYSLSSGLSDQIGAECDLHFFFIGSDNFFRIQNVLQSPMAIWLLKYR